MAPPPDDDAGAADATSLVEMSDEAVKEAISKIKASRDPGSHTPHPHSQVKEAISKIKAAFLRFFVSMMADYQKVMIAPRPHAVT